MSKNNKNNTNIPAINENGKEPSPETPPNTFEKYSVKITAKKLNVRNAPRMEHNVVEILEDATKEYQILEEKNGFGRIGKNKWIMLKHTAEA